jgi:hypothetical protein
MKRIVLLVTVALVFALMMSVAGPASATIHPLSNSECSGLDKTTVAGSQDPPGLTGQSNTDNIAQPIVSVFSAQGPNSPAFKPDNYCPANK